MKRETVSIQTHNKIKERLMEVERQNQMYRELLTKASRDSEQINKQLDRLITTVYVLTGKLK